MECTEAHHSPYSTSRLGRSTANRSAACTCCHCCRCLNCVCVADVTMWLRFWKMILFCESMKMPRLAPSTFSCTTTGSAKNALTSASDSSKSSREAAPRLARCLVRGNLIRSVGFCWATPSIQRRRWRSSSPVTTCTAPKPSFWDGSCSFACACVMTLDPPTVFKRVGWFWRCFNLANRTGKDQLNATAITVEGSACALANHSFLSAAVKWHLSSTMHFPANLLTLASTLRHSLFPPRSSWLTCTTFSGYFRSKAMLTVDLPEQGGPISISSLGNGWECFLPALLGLACCLCSSASSSQAPLLPSRGGKNAELSACHCP
mmetsp:Transcript_38526/g.75791  ORF Transcript_38526/g.75791 Transcript_38526/m.75791 type:complete len:319 (+) Transcript_38526:31-987(+)